MSEWLGVYVAGLITGLMFAVLWDIFKVRRESRKKEMMILSSIRSEISHNLLTLQSNKELLNEELETIFEENNIINTLTLLQSGFEDLFKIDMPETIKGDTLVKLRHIIHPIDSINQQISIREEYKNSDHDISIHYRQIKKFDDRLLRHSDTLIESLEELKALI